MKKYLLVINLPRVEELEVKQEGAAARASKIPDLTFLTKFGQKKINDGDENSWQTIAFDRPLFLDEEKVYYSSWKLPFVSKRVNFCFQNKARILPAPFFRRNRSLPLGTRKHSAAFCPLRVTCLLAENRIDEVEWSNRTEMFRAKLFWRENSKIRWRCDLEAILTKMMTSQLVLLNFFSKAD